MGLSTLIILGILAVVVAYALGTYLRHLSESPDAEVPPILHRLARPIDDRATEVVVHWLLSQAFEQTGVRVADDELAYGRIVEAAVKAIEQLKEEDTAIVSLPFLTADVTGPKHFETRVSRKLVKELIRD